MTVHQTTLILEFETNFIEMVHFIAAALIEHAFMEEHRVAIQDKRHIWKRVVAEHGLVQADQEIKVHATTRTLITKCAVAETIGDDQTTFIQARIDHVGEMNLACRHEQ
ncbi:hypothetical protein D3C87_1834550 [compost metagenome]